mmetsp:Transcript_38463/g.68839  ORF Transcript_38463/g.68839 Transcript_38463/m.68839 type:complete len:442 (+) Transcript_38463:2697-4022(+)
MPVSSHKRRDGVPVPLPWVLQVALGQFAPEVHWFVRVEQRCAGRRLCRVHGSVLKPSECGCDEGTVCGPKERPRVRGIRHERIQRFRCVGLRELAGTGTVRLQRVAGGHAFIPFEEHRLGLVPLRDDGNHLPAGGTRFLPTQGGPAAAVAPQHKGEQRQQEDGQGQNDPEVPEAVDGGGGVHSSPRETSAGLHGLERNHVQARHLACDAVGSQLGRSRLPGAGARGVEDPHAAGRGRLSQRQADADGGVASQRGRGPQNACLGVHHMNVHRHCWGEVGGGSVGHRQPILGHNELHERLRPQPLQAGGEEGVGAQEGQGGDHSVRCPGQRRGQVPGQPHSDRRAVQDRALTHDLHPCHGLGEGGDRGYRGPRDGVPVRGGQGVPHRVQEGLCGAVGGWRPHGEVRAHKSRDLQRGGKRALMVCDSGLQGRGVDRDGESADRS